MSEQVSHTIEITPSKQLWSAIGIIEGKLHFTHGLTEHSPDETIQVITRTEDGRDILYELGYVLPEEEYRDCQEPEVEMLYWPQLKVSDPERGTYEWYEQVDENEAIRLVMPLIDMTRGPGELRTMRDHLVYMHRQMARHVATSTQWRLIKA